jgi:amphi-Trp domain-containing protein
MVKDTSAAVASLLRHLANGIEENESATLVLANETVTVPGDAKVRIDYDRGSDAEELSIKVKWGLSTTLPLLIHTRGDHIEDSFGNRYRVSIYGEPRTDGTWEAYLEFAPTNTALAALRTGRETTQPDKRALEYWATGLEPLYLTGAFERAVART